MLVKQINLQKALELAGKGREVLVLVPGDPEGSWREYMPDTLQNMLDGYLFFRQEPAMENPELEGIEKPEIKPPPCTDEGDAGGSDGPAVDGSSKRTKKIDTGKLLALHKAGWSQQKIADELGVAQTTVSYYLKKMEKASEDRS